MIEYTQKLDSMRIQAQTVQKPTTNLHELSDQDWLVIQLIKSDSSDSSDLSDSQVIKKTQI